MKPGPKPKKTEDLNSWRAKAEARKNEIKVAKPRRPPTCPKWVKGKAREYWKDLAKGMHDNGLLTGVDVLPFSLVCILAGDADLLAEQVGDKTLVTWVCGDSVSERLDPRIKARLETIKQLRSLCNDFGMTPTARIGLPAPKEREGKVIDSKSRFPKG